MGGKPRAVRKARQKKAAKATAKRAETMLRKAILKGDTEAVRTHAEQMVIRDKSTGEEHRMSDAEIKRLQKLAMKLNRPTLWARAKKGVAAGLIVGTLTGGAATGVNLQKPYFDSHMESHRTYMADQAFQSRLSYFDGRIAEAVSRRDAEMAQKRLVEKGKILMQHRNAILQIQREKKEFERSERQFKDDYKLKPGEFASGATKFRPGLDVPVLVKDAPQSVQRYGLPFALGGFGLGAVRGWRQPERRVSRAVRKAKKSAVKRGRKASE